MLITILFADHVSDKVEARVYHRTSTRIRLLYASTLLKVIMADKKASDKSTWLFRPASPDSLSKKLKTCKTRKERQMAVFNDNFEREERRRMERAMMEAEKAAKQAQEDAA
jgi:hypothetical protein